MERFSFDVRGVSCKVGRVRKTVKTTSAVVVSFKQQSALEATEKADSDKLVAGL